MESVKYILLAGNVFVSSFPLGNTITQDKEKHRAHITFLLLDGYPHVGQELLEPELPPTNLFSP